jgi:hypothetical protein
MTPEELFWWRLSTFLEGCRLQISNYRLKLSNAVLKFQFLLLQRRILRLERDVVRLQRGEVLPAHSLIAKLMKKLVFFCHGDK